MFHRERSGDNEHLVDVRACVCSATNVDRYMSRLIISAFILGAAASAAAAETKLTVTPTMAQPGDPVLVTVTGSNEQPTGKANGAALHFFPAKVGYQAVFAIPLDAKPDAISIEIDGVLPAWVRVRDFKFPEATLVVEEELANPGKEERRQIDADNKAILDAAAKSAREAPLFTERFLRPPGGLTSIFGEWRTFNDGHRSQHLGADFGARNGAKVGAINAGTVVLVHENGFLVGNVVVVSHGGGIASAYFHLSKTSVAVGDTVARGAEIGRAGSTGRSTGPHLHLMVRVPGGLVDPVSFMNLPLAPRLPQAVYLP
jgi:murein DD-endopeptidase MepM/ murein hydrolase activator NlpD